MSGRWFLSLILLAVFAAPSLAQPKDRIAGKIGEGRAPLHGNVHRQAQARFDRGRVADSLALSRITLYFNRTAAQQAELDSLLQQQQDPSSPQYHKWLTPQQFGDRFGVSATDMAKAAQWLQGQGFSIVEQSPARTYIAFNGTAAQVRAAFGTELHHYEVGGKMHFANAGEPLLPEALANVTLGIRGLSDFRPKARATRLPQPRFTSDISGNHFVTPDDFATIYHLKPLYDQGIDGTGQSIAVLGQTDLPLADVATFRSRSGLPVNAPVIVNVPGHVTGVSASDIGEADLDVEWAGAVARKATVYFVTVGNAQNLGTFDSMAYAITHNTAPVLSVSYGACEAQWSSSDITTFTSLFQQANTQGQTVVGPAGDAGAGDCESFTATSATHGLAVDFPASSAFVTGVGGTQFNDTANPSQYWASANNSFNGSALSYIPETVWNETSANGSQLAAGGGGKSTLQICDSNGQNCVPNSKPTWQVALTPADNVRDVPDISLAAAFIHEGVLICASQQTPPDCTNGFRDSNQNLDAIGGTSAGAPTFAGMVALLNQAMGSSQGNVNPLLYTLAASSSDAFHDITTGNNIVVCSNPSPDCPASPPFQFGYAAGTGYDYATGLGTVDAYNLISELVNNTTSTPPAPDFTLTTADPTTMTVTHGTSAMVTVTMTGVNSFSGTVTFSCIVPTSLAGVTCTPPAPMSGSGNATFTITASSTASLVPPGGSGTFLAWNWGGGMMVAGLLLGAGEYKKQNRSLRTTLIIGAVLVLLLVLMVGCGGGSSSTVNPPPPPPPPPKAETGTVILQGTSSADVHHIPITVNVN